MPVTYPGARSVEAHRLPREVLIRVHLETIQWLEGRRALELGAQIRGLRK